MECRRMKCFGKPTVTGGSNKPNCMLHKKFSEDESFNDDDYSGHPSTSQTNYSEQKVRRFGQGQMIKYLNDFRGV
ncbi:hypothetical protein TNCV_3383231 [Trichonephila clavipes]|nr:hypothetical protein TNCV_3383231 [Trichonephila clavipes]